MQFRWKTLIVPIAGVAIVAVAGVLGSSSSKAGGWSYAPTMPAFSLKDPADKVHTDKAYRAGPAVVIVTIPNVKHGEYQSRWSRYLLKKGWPNPKVPIIFVEDISQTGSIKEKALAGLKKSYKPDKPPVLLLDMTGQVRRSFRVRNDETVLLVYNKEGRVIYTFDEKPTIDEGRKVLKLVKKF